MHEFSSLCWGATPGQSFVVTGEFHGQVKKSRQASSARLPFVTLNALWSSPCEPRQRTNHENPPHTQTHGQAHAALRQAGLTLQRIHPCVLRDILSASPTLNHTSSLLPR